MRALRYISYCIAAFVAMITVSIVVTSGFENLRAILSGAFVAYCFWGYAKNEAKIEARNVEFAQLRKAPEFQTEHERVGSLVFKGMEVARLSDKIGAGYTRRRKFRGYSFKPRLCTMSIYERLGFELHVFERKSKIVDWSLHPVIEPIHPPQTRTTSDRG